MRLTKGPAAACQNLPCPSAAARRAVGRVGFFSPRDGFSLPGPRTRPADGEELPLGTCTRLHVDSKPLTNQNTSAGPATPVGSKLRVWRQCWVRYGTEASAPTCSSSSRCRGAARPVRSRTARVALRLLRVGNRGFGSSPTLARPTGCRGGAAPWARPIVYYLRPNRYDLNQDRERLPVRH